MSATLTIPQPAAAASLATEFSARLRIAVVTPQLHAHGGTERATLELVSRLAPHHDIHLFARDWQDVPGLTLRFHPVPTLPGPGLLRMLSFYSRAGRALLHTERKHGTFDVIYSPGPNAARVGIATAHFCQARYAEFLRQPRFRLPAATILDHLRHWNRRLYAAAITALERRFYRSSHLRTVLSPSRLLAEDLTRYYGLSPDRIVVAPAGVDCTQFTPEARLALRTGSRAALHLRDRDFVFLFIANGWLLKNLRTVLDALPAVAGATLLVVGAEDPRPLRRYALRLGVASRVFHLPPRPDVLPYYAAADALVAPSLYETFGLVPLEAMATGLPTIISRTMGVAELISDGEAIVLTNAADTAALAAAMRRLTTDASLRDSLSARGLARARQLSWDATHAATHDSLLALARKFHS